MTSRSRRARGAFRGFLPAALAAALLPDPARAGERELLWVCVQDEAKVAVVDMATREVVRVVDLTALGFPATAMPHHVAVEPDGSHWYVSLIGAGVVLKLDREDRIVARYAMEAPGMLALDAAAGLLVVGRSMSAVNPPARVAVLETDAMEGEEVGVLFPRPHPMVVVGGRAYTGSLGVNQLASISLAEGRVDVIQIPGPPHSLVQFAVSPDGATLVASTDRSGRLLVFDLSEPSSPAPTASVDVGAMAFDPVFTPDGGAVWVPVKSTNEVVVVETAGWSVVRRIRDDALRQPHQVVFTADGATAFVSNNNKADHMAGPGAAEHAGHAVPGAGGPAALVVIDVASAEVVGAVELGRNLTGMGARAPR